MIFSIYWDALTICIGSQRTVQWVAKQCLLTELINPNFDFWRSCFLQILDMTCLLGYPRSLNDINILDHPLVFNKLHEDRALKCEYVVNGHKYNIIYFLSTSIYPKWVTFVKNYPPFARTQRKIVQ